MQLNSIQSFIVSAVEKSDIYRENIFNSAKLLWLGLTELMFEEELSFLIKNKFIYVEGDKLKILYNGVEYLKERRIIDQNKLENDALNNLT